jgi:hypothetical protein
LPSWIRIRIRNLNADPDPATQINADPDPKPWLKVHPKIALSKKPNFLRTLSVR